MIGDVQRGPSSIVAAVGTARRATDAILSRENIRSHQNDKYWNNVNPAEIYQRKGDISITLVNSDDRDAFVAQKPHAALNVTTFAASVWMSARTAPTSPLRFTASRTVSRRCISMPTATNAATAPNSARGTVNRTKTKSPSSACRKTLITAATQSFLVEDCRVRVRLNNQSWVLNIDSEGQFNNVPPELNDMCRIISHVHQHHHYLLDRVEV